MEMWKRRKKVTDRYVKVYKELGDKEGGGGGGEEG